MENKVPSKRVAEGEAGTNRQVRAEEWLTPFFQD